MIASNSSLSIRKSTKFHADYINRMIISNAASFYLKWYFVNKLLVTWYKITKLKPKNILVFIHRTCMVHPKIIIIFALVSPSESNHRTTSFHDCFRIVFASHDTVLRRTPYTAARSILHVLRYVRCNFLRRFFSWLTIARNASFRGVIAPPFYWAIWSAMVTDTRIDAVLSAEIYARETCNCLRSKHCNRVWW